MGRRIGIDFGTTYSVMAVIEPGGCKVLQNMENEQSMRSIVSHYEDSYLVGKPALQCWPLVPKDTIVSIKRLMGRAFTDKEVKKIMEWATYEIAKPSDGTEDSVCVKLGGKEYSPIGIAAIILKKLKEDAEKALGEEVSFAVITVPAYFSDRQKQATREAGLKADLTVLKILDEPTAAAIAFGVDSKKQDAKTILVFDLGGGTLDVSVLMMSAGAFVPLDLEGDMWLGGDDFDKVIVDYVLEDVEKKNGKSQAEKLKKDSRFITNLKLEAQKAKETLSQAKKTKVIIPSAFRNDSGDNIDIITDVSRDQFEELIKPLVDKSISLVNKAIDNAHLTLKQVDYVLMAGSSTCIPLIQQEMESLFGKEKVLRKVHPKFSVAMGAAMNAAWIDEVECVNCRTLNKISNKKCKKCNAPLFGSNLAKNFKGDDIDKAGIVPFPYGFQTVDDKFHVVINKGDPFPTPEDKRVVQRFYTSYPGQRIICIPIYGGEHKDHASKNEKHGEAIVYLPNECPEETAVLVKLWLNSDGYFELEAKLEDGTDLSPNILSGDKLQLIKIKLEDIEEKGRKNKSRMD